MANPPIKNEPVKQSEETQIRAIPNNVGPVISAAEVSSLIANAVAEALKVAIPAAAVGINQANIESQGKTREAAVREAVRRTQRCPICAQPVTACGGAWERDKEGKEIIKLKEDGSPNYTPELNHMKAYIGPKDPNLFKWYQGERVNGVRYLSDYPGHQIWIPKKSDILTSINAWENNEHDLMQKRTAEGQGVGVVGPGGATRTNQNAIGWR